MVTEIIVKPYIIITYGSSGWTASENELGVKKETALEIAQ